MVLSLLYGKKYLSPRIGTIDLDITITEQHRFNSRVTTYPVENGTIVSDHIINEPDVVVLQTLVSDTPINILSPRNRSIDVFNRLIEIHQRREPVTVITGLKVYPSMAITSLEVPRDLRTGQALTFTIELQRIIFANVSVQINNTDAFGGPQNAITREQVRDNAPIPLIQDDPPNSLKDQAASGINAGLQSLIPVPIASIPSVLEVRNLIFGVV